LISLNSRSSNGTLFRISAYFVNHRSRSHWKLAVCSDWLSPVAQSDVSIAWICLSSPPFEGGSTCPGLPFFLVSGGVAALGPSQCDALAVGPQGRRGHEARLFSSMRSSCPEDIGRMFWPWTLITFWPKSSINPCLRMKGVPIIISYWLMLMTSK